MVLFLSGNFPQLVSLGKEKAFREKLREDGHPYHRLITFYYPKHCETVLSILREEEKEIWEQQFKAHTVQVAELTWEQAQEALDAAKDDLDYTMNPLDAVMEKISYWGD